LQIALLPATELDKPALANLVQLYLYDCSELTSADVDDHGCFRYPQLDMYWTEAGRYPFLIRIDNRMVGFALVNRHSRLHDPFDGHAVAEFFVMRRYRRIGIGRAAAMQLFDRFPGRWEIASLATNVLAHAFWRSTLDSYTGGCYDEIWFEDGDWRGRIQSFVASDRVNRV
jgi:predicted acetyltransferase